ncbi:MAG: hypothetical protein IPP90_19160 [Gemmatimonadaceae bacterium]|nr:hypothetical protein [Gemmatimonadaceae bacterium]
MHRYRRSMTGVTTLVLTLIDPVTTLHAQSTSSPREGRRFRADSFWVRSWVRGGPVEPELFVEPRQLRVADGVVFVLDLGTREVIAMDVDSGRTRFSLSARGEGPGEFKRPALLVGNGSQFGVLDHATSRLTLFGANGAMMRNFPIPDAANVESACVLSGGHVLVKATGVREAVRLIDSVGRVQFKHSLPVADPNIVPPTFLMSANYAGPTADDRCALVPLYGRRWFTVDTRGLLVPHPFIEPGADPTARVDTKALDKSWRGEMRRQIQTSTMSPISRGALQVGDTLLVPAGATRRSPHRLLDYYLISSGRYLFSRRLPTTFTALAVGPNGTFFGAVIGDETSWVIALRPAKHAAKRR